MKKNKQIFISLFIITLGFGIFTFINKRNVRINDNIIKMPWTDIRKDQLEELDIILYKNKEELSYTIKKNSGIWQIIEPIQIEAMPEKAIILANAFLNLHPSEKLINTTSEEYESYGLNSPVLKVSGIFKNNKTNSFCVGSKTSIGNQYYISDGSSHQAYIIDNKLLEPFIQGLSGIINNNLINKPIDNIVSIEFRNFEGTLFSFGYIDGFWIQTYPSENKQLDWGIRRFLLSIKNLTFDPNSINFNISDSILKDIGINIDSSPKLKIVFDDDSYSEFYIGLKRPDGKYPVYSIGQQLIGFSASSIVQEIFQISEKDFSTIK